MSRTAHKLISASGGKAYEIEQSLLVSAGDSSKLRRTPVSEGNRKTFTFSTWCKRAKIGSGSGGSDHYFLMGAFVAVGSPDDSHYFQFGFDTNNRVTCSGWSTHWRKTSKLFRDTASWYHLVLQFDTTQSTADNRIKIYVNGVQDTDFGTKNNPSQNYDVAINNTVQHAISDVAYDQGTGPYHFDGYMAETYLFDGAVVAASEFGETDSDTGQWIPKKYTGTASYGTNGYYMKYVSGAFADDSSGNGNNHTATNLAASDVVLDSPTNNFPVFNYLNTGSNMTLTQGGLKTTASGWADTFPTMKVPFTGKWYWELANTTDGNGYFGIWTDNYTDTDASQDYGTGKQATSPGNLSGVSGYFSSAWSSGDIIAMAVDCDNGKLWWSKNGTWGSSGNPATGANQGLTFTATDGWNIILAGASGFVANINFGQNGTFTGTKTAQGNTDGAGVGNFYYAPPSGFKALCTKNLPTPAAKKSSEHFNTVLYTGDASSEGSGDEQAITGVGFQPDFVWLKARSTGANHLLHDVIRGPTKFIRSDTTDAEGTQAEGLKSFDSDGFTVGDSNAWNQNSRTLVAWNWKAGGSGSANNSGDINATVSANPTAGFSIVSWTGNSSNGDTIAHGLGKVPSVIFYKNREASSLIYVVTTAIDGSQDYLALGSTTFAAASTWGAPATNTISNWTFGANDIIAYVWAEIEGFSKFGSYEGNGNAAGPFVNTGFRPAYVMLKSADATYSWRIIDNKRNPYNVMDDGLWADLSNAESASTSNLLDFYSNGFKLRGSGNGTNKSGDTYLYMAFAEFPFKYANAR